MEKKNLNYKPPIYKIFNTNVTINIPGLSLNFGTYPNAGLNGLSFGGNGAPLSLLGAYRTYAVGGLELNSYPYARSYSLAPGFSYGRLGSFFSVPAIKAEKIENKNVTINIINEKK